MKSKDKIIDSEVVRAYQEHLEKKEIQRKMQEALVRSTSRLFSKNETSIRPYQQKALEMLKNKESVVNHTDLLNGSLSDAYKKAMEKRKSFKLQKTTDKKEVVIKEPVKEKCPLAATREVVKRFV